MAVTPRYRFMWGLVRVWSGRSSTSGVTGLEHWPAPPFQLVANHHNGWDPLLVIAVVPLEPRITWFGPKEADFGRGFKNRVMAFFGGMIPYNPAKTTLTTAVAPCAASSRPMACSGIFAEGRIGFRESRAAAVRGGRCRFAARAGVPVVPCAIVGSTDLWFRRRIEVRFGPSDSDRRCVRGREARAELESRIRAAVADLLPRDGAAAAAPPSALLPDRPAQRRR